MKNAVDILDKISRWVGITAFVIWLLLIIYLVFEFKYPEICTYDYITVDNIKGNSKECDTGASGTKYCRLNIKETVKVQSYNKVCKRK